MKHNAAQFPMNWGQPEDFKLVPQTAIDGERLAREKAVRDLAKAEAEAKQIPLTPQAPPPMVPEPEPPVQLAAEPPKPVKVKLRYSSGACELVVRGLRECCAQKPSGDTPQAVADYFRAHVASFERHNPEVENMYAIYLNVRRRIIGHTHIGTGVLDTLLVHPREVFRPAIAVNCAALVLIHNHPSGDPTPSEADIKITRDLIRAGQLIKIEVLDHLVMGDFSNGQITGYTSLRELGYFYS